MVPVEEAAAWASTADDLIAHRIAAEAGRLLVELRSAVGRQLSGRELGARGDAVSHRLIVTRLEAMRPDDAILSEESRDDGRRLGRRRVWIVDPLDGTREFGEPDRDDWAVHVALCTEGEPVVGAVSLPARRRTFSTARPPAPPGPRGGRVRLAVSRTRPPALASAIAEGLDAEMVPMGSAGAKAMAVVLGEVDVYLHAGGQYEWDSAAPVAVARSAGLHTSRLDGSALAYNAAEPYLPDLLICRPELAERVLRGVQRGLTTTQPH